MPFTPLHFGVALPVRELVGHQNFSLWAFTVTQVLFDLEPGVKMVANTAGDLHTLTHNPLVGAAIAIVTIAIFWRKYRWAAVFGSIFGVVTHLWLDMMYHADVANALAKWGIADSRHYDAESICLLGFFFWLLFAGIRKAIKQRRENAEQKSEGKIESSINKKDLDLT